MLYAYTGYCGTGEMNLQKCRVRVWMSVQNSQKFRVRIWMLYITYRCCGTSNTRANMVLYVPYRTQPWNFALHVIAIPQSIIHIPREFLATPFGLNVDESTSAWYTVITLLASLSHSSTRVAPQLDSPSLVHVSILLTKDTSHILVLVSSDSIPLQKPLISCVRYVYTTCQRVEFVLKCSRNLLFRSLTVSSISLTLMTPKLTPTSTPRLRLYYFEGYYTVPSVLQICSKWWHAGETSSIHVNSTIYCVVQGHFCLPCILPYRYGGYPEIHIVWPTASLSSGYL